jgi:CheY-like chemotaxis protein
MEKRPIDVNGWIREASSFLVTSLESTESLRLDLDPRAGKVEGDPHQLDQLLLNLVLNARDAIGGEGTIRIATVLFPPGSCERVPPARRDQPYVEIKVEDSGCGIPADHLTRIFDPFFTTKETGKGTGLGLSVAYNLIRQHGGEIFVQSQEGKGSTFSILLPHASLPESEKRDGKRAGKVLVSETNPRMLDLFKDVLAGMRYEIIPVENQQEAVDVYARQKDAIECVILDGRFERSTGGSSLGRILDLNPHIKVILTCSEAATPLGQWFDSAKEKGARIQQISLPVTPEILSVSLEEALCGGSA